MKIFKPVKPLKIGVILKDGHDRTVRSKVMTVSVTKSEIRYLSN